VLCGQHDSGSLGRAPATLVIIFIGVGATLGKVLWGMAITVAVGISVILGAPTVLFALTGLVSGC
jgi:type IV secretory pathway VirB2 component (pilin)